MNVKKLGLAIVVSCALGSIAVPSVFAVESRQNIRAEVRQEVREEVRERVASNPGFVKKFFGGLLARASLGKVTLTAVSGTTLTVKDADGKTYTVTTDAKTQFRRRFWGKSSLAEYQIGDTLAIIGKWTDDAHTTIAATTIRDISIQKRFGVFFGTVTSVTSTGLVIDTINRGSQTVTIDSTTKLFDRKQSTIQQAAIVVGHKVRVHGLWNNTAKTITEVTVVKDFSLPIVPTPTTAQ